MPDNELLWGGSRHTAANAKQGLQCQDSEEQTIPWQLTSLNPSGLASLIQKEIWKELTCREAL